MLYSETEAHIVNLDRCASRDLRRAYLALLLAAERAGFVTLLRTTDSVHELQIRDPGQRLLFAVQVAPEALIFELRRPALDARPELAGQAQLRFAGRLSGSAGSGAIAIRLLGERDAEDLVDWLLAGGVTTLRAAAERWFG
ncbi:hypothetical protein IP88_04690 [alpha proteobacterium AAP81b]|nr:hypothetical protein IP88_04690 [alpha proteobacterium AAP81b]